MEELRLPNKAVLSLPALPEPRIPDRSFAAVAEVSLGLSSLQERD